MDTPAPQPTDQGSHGTPPGAQTGTASGAPAGAWTGHGPAGPPPGPRPQPSGGDSFFDAVRRTGLVRSDERWVGGVAGGVALRLGIDPLVVRGLLGVSVLLGGLGLILYAVGWALLPEQRDGRIHLQQLFRGDFDAALIGAFVVLVSGLAFPDRWNPGMWWGGGVFRSDWWTVLLWLSAIAVVVLVVTSANRGRAAGGGPTAYAPPAPRPAPSSSDPRPDDTTQEGRPMTLDPNTQTQPLPTAPATGQWGATSSGYTAPATAYPSGYQAYQHPTYTGEPGRTGLPPRGGGPTGPGAPATALPRRHPSGPGAAAVGVVAALSLLGLAGLMYADRVGEFDGPTLLAAGAVSVVLAGLGIVVSALRGRTSGALGVYAVLVTIALVPLLAISQTVWEWNAGGTAVGDLVRTPTTVTEAEDGFSLGAGQARVDLTEVPLDEGRVDVPISVGAGDVLVVVPEDGDFTIDVQVFAGDIDWRGDRLPRTGRGDSILLESTSVADGAEPDLVLDVTVGAGRLTVVEE